MTSCACGLPRHAFNLERPCCSARMADGMLRMRPSLAFWWIAKTKPPMTEPDLERFREAYRKSRNVAKIP